MKRLFVVVTSQAFGDYLHGKEWEIRCLKGRFAPEYLGAGRRVEIRKGYGGQSLWKRLTGDYVTGTLEEIFAKIPLQNAEPRATSIEEAVRENREMMHGEQYIAFRMI